jgi:hypothetical protein
MITTNEEELLGLFASIIAEIIMLEIEQIHNQSRNS